MPDDKSDPLSAPSSLKYGVLLPEPVNFGPLCVYFTHAALTGRPELEPELICAIYSGLITSNSHFSVTWTTLKPLV